LAKISGGDRFRERLICRRAEGFTDKGDQTDGFGDPSGLPLLKPLGAVFDLVLLLVLRRRAAAARRDPMVRREFHTGRVAEPALDETCHREALSGAVAIPTLRSRDPRDCFASLAMTAMTAAGIVVVPAQGFLSVGGAAFGGGDDG
jgi:hypothetical protein